ncbi:MAG: DUF4982 domain-containing protein, partial [Clostridia bacterium]|nr:DUF4982 domain-containing protein [Clostridia bacterium]
VYSNCGEVELFANGVSVGKQKKGKYPFFYFDVKNVGETTLKAVAGDLSDESTIRKVDTPNEAYILKDEGDVINWFEINTPDGYFSINDEFGAIWATTKGKIVLLKVVFDLAMKMKNKKKKDGKGGDIMGFSLDGIKVKPDMIKSLFGMISGFSFKRASSMVKGIFTKEDLLSINAKLNKIKKK